MDDIRRTIRTHDIFVRDLESLAASTLKLLVTGKNANSRTVEYIVQTFYRTDVSIFENTKKRDSLLVEMRRMYMFLRFLYYGYRSQEVADEFKCSRQTIHHHCYALLDEYDSDVPFKNKLLVLFSEEIMESLRTKLLKIRRYE
jgi:predicted DNA-binding protein YlxM (UPF0122 family)